MEKRKYIMPNIKVRAVTTAYFIADSFDTGDTQDPKPDEPHYAKGNAFPDGYDSGNKNNRNVWDE